MDVSVGMHIGLHLTAQSPLRWVPVHSVLPTWKPGLSAGCPCRRRKVERGCREQNPGSRGLNRARALPLGKPPTRGPPGPTGRGGRWDRTTWSPQSWASLGKCPGSQWLGYTQSKAATGVHLGYPNSWPVQATCPKEGPATPRSLLLQPQWLFRCSSDTPDGFQPQDLCTCCPFQPEALSSTSGPLHLIRASWVGLTWPLCEKAAAPPAPPMHTFPPDMY